MIHYNMGTFIPESECRVPPGAIVVRVKICETCGFPFITRLDKNCHRCHANPVPLGRTTLEILEDLKNELPILLL
jgi:hypothetical protein